jgi:hypothetical protein
MPTTSTIPESTALSLDAAVLAIVAVVVVPLISIGRPWHARLGPIRLQ